MNKKIIVYIAVAVILLLLLLSSFGMINFNSSASGNSGSGNMPEKCRKPEGQTLEAWKEHLGHHAETQECLDYYK